jgi:hypothetical protein
LRQIRRHTDVKGAISSIGYNVYRWPAHVLGLVIARQ